MNRPLGHGHVDGGAEVVEKSDEQLQIVIQAIESDEEVATVLEQ